MAGGDALDNLAFHHFIGQLTGGPVAHRAVTLGGVFERHRNDLNDLFGGERRGRSRSRRIRERRFQSGNQETLDFAGIGRFQKEGGFHFGQEPTDRRPTIPPEPNGIGFESQRASDLFIGKTVARGQDDPTATD